MNTTARAASHQLDLFGPRAPEVSSDEVAAFMELLRGGQWKTARQCEALDESAKRTLRAIAEASEGQIISGQRGYNLTLEATPADMDETTWWRNQELLGVFAEVDRL